MQGDNLYILSTCNATYSYILLSHIDINRLHVGINEIHFIDKFHIYNNLLYDKKIKLYVDLKSYMSTNMLNVDTFIGHVNTDKLSVDINKLRADTS